MARLLRRRGLRVLELDARGLVRSTDEGFEADMDGPLRVIGRRLVAVDATDQPALEQAVATGRDSLGAAALAPLTAESGRRYLLQVLPVPGRARDVFLSASTLAILIETEAQTPRFRLSPSTLRAAFGLTDREAEVASLLAEGASLVVVAKRLRIESATARTHLKRIFEKTCTSRQGELVALLAQLRL
jgi:DNA-binding CsgD family transcriptional regulator